MSIWPHGPDHQAAFCRLDGPALSRRIAGLHNERGVSTTGKGVIGEILHHFQQRRLHGENLVVAQNVAQHRDKDIIAIGSHDGRRGSGIIEVEGENGEEAEAAPAPAVSHVGAQFQHSVYLDHPSRPLTQGQILEYAGFYCLDCKKGPGWHLVRFVSFLILP